MCPDAERVDRERNGEIELFERVDPASSFVVERTAVRQEVHPRGG